MMMTVNVIKPGVNCGRGRAKYRHRPVKNGAFEMLDRKGNYIRT
jgi:hypothetical protein